MTLPKRIEYRVWVDGVEIPGAERQEVGEYPDLPEADRRRLAAVGIRAAARIAGEFVLAHLFPDHVDWAYARDAYADTLKAREESE